MESIFAWAIPVDAVQLAATVDTYLATKRNLQNFRQALQDDQFPINRLPVELVDLVECQLRNPAKGVFEFQQSIFNVSPISHVFCYNL